MERFKITPAVYVILERDGKLLLLKRQNTGHQDGRYSFVAGHLDGNETVIEAAIREAKEEAGIELDKDDVKVVHVMHRKYTDEERVDFFVETDKWKGEPKNMEPEKCSDLAWFPKEELPENTIAYIKLAIEKLDTGAIYSEFGW